MGRHFARIQSMKIYGLRGVTHGAAQVLTVMSPEGANAARAHMARTDDLIVSAGDGRLTQYLEQRDGAIARLVETYGVEVLPKDEWDRRKQALGDAIWD